MAFKAIMSMLILGLATQATAYWVLGCGKPVSIDRADPIISPGVLSSHLHTIMGGDGFSLTTSFENTQRSTCTTCAVPKDLSNYWVPTVYFHHKNGTFSSVEQVGGVNVYYQQRIDHAETEVGKTIQPLPKGLRMVAGDPTARTWSSTLEHRAIHFVCLPGEHQQGVDPFNGFPNRTCDGGLQIRVRFPCCWNGKDVDSADHHSHMAYPSMVDNGPCPDTHPVRVMSLLYESTWSVSNWNHLRTAGDQPFVLSNGDPVGYSYHGDFLNGWDTELLRTAISHPSCGDATGGKLELCELLAKGMLSDDGQNACKTLAPHTKEPVSGNIDKLPGCNPVWTGKGARDEDKC